MNTAETKPIEHKAALIIGLGQTGAASARWLHRMGYALRLLDTRSDPAGFEDLRSELGESLQATHFGEHEPNATLFEGLELAVVSPGLMRTEEPVSGWLEHVRTAGAEALGEIELFARALKELGEQRGYQPKVLGVTGTNGKTTVTALARRMIEAGGMSACAAGNISPAALDALMLALDQNALPQAWVLELSSFQLVSTSSLQMDAAVVLNISQDHLDWHGSLKAYCEAKARIFSMAKVAIVNRDDSIVMAMVDGLQNENVRSFGSNAPLLTDDLGLETAQGMSWLVSAEAAQFDDFPRAKRRKNDPPPSRETGRAVRLMPADALPMVGRHNVMNVLASALLAKTIGMSWTPILKAAADYDGEPHRMRFVRTVREVEFFNDSKGTNVGATIAGIDGLNRRVILIAGGVGKGQDFSLLAKKLHQTQSVAVLIGADALVLKDAFETADVICHLEQTMQSGVERAFELAEPGDAVVLSPACASFDMFRNYGHRGEVFVDAVHELALSLGEVA